MVILKIERTTLPKNIAETPNASGGDMADGTYYYIITLVNSYREGLGNQDPSGIKDLWF